MKATWTRYGWRLLISAALALIGIYLVAMVGYAVAAGPACDPDSCARCATSSRLYGRQRTDAEFALAKAEVARQVLDERVRGLEAVLDVLNKQ